MDKIAIDSIQDYSHISNVISSSIRSSIASKRTNISNIVDARSRILAKKQQGLVAKRVAASDDAVSAEVEKKLLKWLDSLLASATQNIQVNGLDFDVASKDTVQAYEPYDEFLREKADFLLETVQDLSVSTTKMRCSVPRVVKVMVADSLAILGDITENAHIIETPTPHTSNIPPIPLDSSVLADTTKVYTNTTQTCAQVSASVLPKLEKARRANDILDTYGVPHAEKIGHGGVVDALSPVRSKRRQSSVAKAPVTPRTARFGLLKRLDVAGGRGVGGKMGNME